MSDRTQDFAVKLLNEHWPTLIELNDEAIDAPSWKRTLLRSISVANELWNTLTKEKKISSLRTLFVDQTEFNDLLVATISDQRFSMLSAARLVLKRVDPMRNFDDIERLFEASDEDAIGNILPSFSHHLSSNSRILATHISQCRRLTKHDDVYQFCVLLHAISVDQHWSLVREAFKQMCTRPAWPTAVRFVNIINETYSVNERLRRLNEQLTRDEKLQAVVQLCNDLSGNQSLTLSDDALQTIRSLPSQSLSKFEILTKIQPFVFGAVRVEIDLLLRSMTVMEGLLADVPVRSLCELDTVSTMWQTVFRLRDTNTARIFDAIAALLVSFDGLVMSKGDAFLQQLFATNMAAAMCTVAHLRTTITPSHSLFCSSVDRLFNSRSSQSKHSITDRRGNTVVRFKSKQNINDRSLQTVFVFRRDSKENVNVSHLTDYIRRNNALLAPPDDISDVGSLLKSFFSHRTAIAQWYDAFVTFNVFVQQTPTANTPERISIGVCLVQRALQILRNLLIVRFTLEATFTADGIRFLIDELTRVETCLRSLSLDKCPHLRKALALLRVDISETDSRRRVLDQFVACLFVATN